MRLRLLAATAIAAAAVLPAGVASATCTPAGIPTCETRDRVKRHVCGAFVTPPRPPC
jgi:hypothetical protein